MPHLPESFYQNYFDSASYEMFKYDVGAFCTRKSIVKEINKKNGSVLEIGVGIASLLEDLQAFECYGIDISEQTLARSKQIFDQHFLKASFYQANATQLPFEADTFDFVVSAHVFEHIELDEVAFNEVLRVLKPGGLFILFVPGSLNGAASKEEWLRCGHFRNYNHQHLLRLENSTSSKLFLRKALYVHKVHNFIWNKLKHLLRYANYPIKKFLLRDNRDIEQRPMYQKFILPLLTNVLDAVDNLTKTKEAYLLGTKFNVLAVFEKK